MIYYYVTYLKGISMFISASRRTDIPAFYSEWFMNRIKEGYVIVRNPMNHNQLLRIILSSDIVTEKARNCKNNCSPGLSYARLPMKWFRWGAEFAIAMVIYVAIYTIIWLINYLYWKHTVKEMNDQLEILHKYQNKNTGRA